MHPQSSPARGPRADSIRVLVIIGGVIALLIVASATGLWPAAPAVPAPAAGPAAANPYTVWRICRERVSAELKAPAGAHFPGYDERGISHSGSLWTVASYVDAQNSFGAQLRTPYSCSVRFHPADATYDVEGVSVR